MHFSDNSPATYAHAHVLSRVDFALAVCQRATCGCQLYHGTTPRPNHPTTHYQQQHHHHHRTTTLLLPPLLVRRLLLSSLKLELKRASCVSCHSPVALFWIRISEPKVWSAAQCSASVPGIFSPGTSAGVDSHAVKWVWFQREAKHPNGSNSVCLQVTHLSFS